MGRSWPLGPGKAGGSSYHGHGLGCQHLLRGQGGEVGQVCQHIHQGDNGEGDDDGQGQVPATGRGWLSEHSSLPVCLAQLASRANSEAINTGRWPEAWAWSWRAVPPGLVD